MKITVKLITKMAIVVSISTAYVFAALEWAQPEEGPRYVPGEVLVKLKEKESAEVLFTRDYFARRAENKNTLAKLKARHRLRDERPVFNGLHNRLKKDNLTLTELSEKIEGRSAARPRRMPLRSEKIDLFPIYVLKTDKDVLATCEELKKDPDVEYAEPNYLATINAAPNDANYPVQWSLHNIGQDYPTKISGPARGIPDADIDAQEAWDIHTGSPDVIVAVLDTGVDYNHPDINPNMWKNTAEQNGVTGLDDDGNGYIDDIYGYDFCRIGKPRDPDPMDTAGHGTHCAGIIAAAGNNGREICGVSWNSKIMALKFIDMGTGDLADASDAFYYAVDNGAHVISNSWDIEEYTYVLRDAVAYAHANGMIIVAAAANGNKDYKVIPAVYENVIAVAATDSSDQKASFSNYGWWVDVAAPGVDILSLKDKGGTTVKSGTSMSCPTVAGLAALILSYKPDLTNDEVEAIIKRSCDDLGDSGRDIYFGYGRINAYKALVSTSVYINSPAEDAFIQDEADIRGSAYSPLRFSKYELYSAPAQTPDETTLLCSSLAMVENGVLCRWNTLAVSDGRHILTLKVTLTDQTEVVHTIEVIVDNINNPPEFKLLRNRGAIAGKLLEFKIVAEDMDDPALPKGQLAYAVINLPPRAQFADQMFSWLPVQTDKGAYAVTFVVSDSEHTVQKNISIRFFDIRQTLINDPPFYYPADTLSIYEDKIVWANTQTGISTLYLYDIPSGVTTPLVAGRNPYLYENTIVYSAPGQGGFLDIFTYDISTGEQTQITSGPHNHTYPIMHHDTIAWSDWRNGNMDAYGRNSDIYFYSISRKMEAPAMLNPGSITSLAVYQDKIVWSECNLDTSAFSKSGSIFMHNTLTGAGGLISDAPANLVQLTTIRDISITTIYEDRIVWNDKRAGNSNLYAYNLSTGSERQITAYDGDEYSPAIHEDTIAYLKDQEVCLYSISQDQEIQITDDGNYKQNIGIFGNNIVWQSWRNYYCEYHMATIVASIIYGDVDGIPGITAQDALVVLKHAAAIEFLSADLLEAADVDDTDNTTSEDITAQDALLILMRAAGIPVVFPAEQN